MKKDTYLSKIDGMVFGDSEQSGIQRGDEFYHGPLNFYISCPETWEIINTPNKLIFSSPYGQAILQMTLEDLNFKETPKDYLKRLVSNSFEEEELKINGLNSYTAIIKRSGRLSRIAIIFKDDKVYRFIGSLEDKDSDINQYDSRFLRIINSFRMLTKEEQDLSKPLRLKTYIVKSGDTYQSLAKDSSININAEDQLRLLNGDYPDKTLKIGRMIKIVE